MKKISPKITSRILLYLRTLESLLKEKNNLISSRELASITGLTDVQIRKDVSNFGKIGTPRIGYPIRELKGVLEDFVLRHEAMRVVLFGAGNLGQAILKYPGFHPDKIKLVAAFDCAENQVGKIINGTTVYAVSRAPAIIKKTRADIGIIAVPEESSQEVADLMVLSGLRGIVNFSPRSINVPKKVYVKDIDFTIEFLALFCDINQ
ncbi:MAG: redox-sensing transcriptional repressor Rex [Candidatus Omnitrophota bacterium]